MSDRASSFVSGGEETSSTPHPASSPVPSPPGFASLPPSTPLLETAPRTPPIFSPLPVGEIIEPSSTGLLWLPTTGELVHAVSSTVVPYPIHVSPIQVMTEGACPVTFSDHRPIPSTGMEGNTHPTQDPPVTPAQRRKTSVRKCPGCRARMSSIEWEPHSLCINCRGFNCCIQSRCNECQGGHFPF